MSNTAHIFTPENSSLEDRIHAYKTMRNEFNNIELSQKLSENKEWQDRLGTPDELKQAHNIIKNSLRATLNNIRDVDLQNAQKQGLMTNKEVSEFSISKQSFENSTDQKQAQIDKNRADIKNARSRSDDNEKNNDFER